MTKPAKWVRDLTEEVMPQQFDIGDVITSPDGRRVKIVGGEYWGEHGLSNFWSFREVMGNGKLSKKLEHSYGWNPPEKEGTASLRQRPLPPKLRGVEATQRNDNKPKGQRGQGMKAKQKPRKSYMSADEFKRALKSFGWTDKEAAMHLHLSRVQINRLGNSVHGIKGPIVLLLNYMAHFGRLPRSGWKFGKPLFFKEHGA